MDRRTHKGAAGGDPLGRGPRGNRAEEAASEVPPAASVHTDPELEQDLGAEFEFRGDQLEAELEAAREEAGRHLETAQRLQAEFDNYRKRMAREQEDAVKRAGQRIITEVLPALDNLERAVAHAEEAGESSDLTDGVRMVLQQVLDVFAKEGVERIAPEGEPFDPNEHQAVGQAERDDVPEGTCVDMYQCGYRMHGRVLRPAAVVVSTGGPRP
ncbi:MAG TPA: nucleotide exchange factor GrpE [Actinobacteria bacterium]|nr:nucleotide exchange factor GrpE [Actinomycetota bacterium]